MSPQGGPAPHKLLLTWNGASVIEHVLQAWSQSLAAAVIVVVRADHTALQAACRRWAGVDVVIPPRDPADMKQSIQWALRHAEEHYAPQPTDRWLVAPADLPTISSRLIDGVIAASRQTGAIVGPRFGDRRGHPVSFPWSLAPRVFQLAEDEGINRLLEEQVVDWLRLPGEEYLADLDTPDDYRRLVAGRAASPPP